MNPWLKGLLAAIISGASNAITMVVVDPLHFAPTLAGWTNVLSVALVSGAFSGALYLKRSPLPDFDAR